MTKTPTLLVSAGFVLGEVPRNRQGYVLSNHEVVTEEEDGEERGLV
jgi:hypothetical protein